MQPSRNLSILISAALIGLGLGPMCLKRIAPCTHQHLFEGTTQPTQELAEFDSKASENRLRLSQTGVTNQAITEFDKTTKRDRKPYLQAITEARTERVTQLGSLSSALILATLIMMTCESVTAGRGTGARISNQLATARYALLGAWLLLALAQPLIIANVSALLVVLLVAVTALPIAMRKA